MIEYELAKKLKDAGFPIEWKNPRNTVHHTKTVVGISVGTDNISVPTLSELIEACGDGIFELLRQSEWHRNETGFIWIATLADVSKMTHLSFSQVGNSMVKSGGSTPEEAVANLWLELNKK